MKHIAMIKAGVVVGVALWDGVRPWDPVAGGLCDSTADVTSASPRPGPGWTYSGGVFADPGPSASGPDPIGFVRAVFEDSSIPIATRLALVPWRPAIEENLSAPPLISGAWAALVAEYAISPANQATVRGYAATFGIPGI